MAKTKETEAHKTVSSPRDLALVAAAALTPAEVQRQTSQLKARLAWLRTLILLSESDRKGLLEAPLDPPLSPEELDLLPPIVELIGEVVVITDKRAESRLTDAEVQKLVALRVAQGTLDRALRVRFRADRGMRRVLTQIRRGEPGDPADMLDDARRLVAISEDPKNAAWIVTLKKGEPGAVAMLREAIPGLETQSNRVAAAGGASIDRDRLRRLWTLALRIADRVVTAGKYHTSDIAGRAGDYARFKPPAARKPRKKTE